VRRAPSCLQCVLGAKKMPLFAVPSRFIRNPFFGPPAPLCAVFIWSYGSSAPYEYLPLVLTSESDRTSTYKVYPKEMEEPVQSNKPPGDAFRQQKLRAWQPIMTPLKVVAIFMVIGITFIPTGVSLIKSSNAVS
jgi:hypothetical protein